MLLASGQTLGEVAARHWISPATVRRHLEQAMQRHHCATYLDLVTLALDCGWLQ